MPKRRRRRVVARTEQTVPGVRPNAGIEAWYRSVLDRHISAMQRSVTYWTESKYNAAVVAADASPATAMQRELAKLNSRWQGIFDRLAKKLSTQLSSRVTGYADRTLHSSLRAKGFSVNFTLNEAMRDAYQAVRLEQVNLIRSIPRQCLAEVSTIVMQSVARGRDLATLSEQLQQRFGVTKSRAALIARDQNNKATAVMTGARQESLGLDEGIWRHSHAGKEPRKSHVAASGVKFHLKKGLYLDGKWVMPGEEINCRCTWDVVIPGLPQSTRVH